MHRASPFGPKVCCCNLEIRTIMNCVVSRGSCHGFMETTRILLPSIWIGNPTPQEACFCAMQGIAQMPAAIAPRVPNMCPMCWNNLVIDVSCATFARDLLFLANSYRLERYNGSLQMQTQISDAATLFTALCCEKSSQAARLAELLCAVIRAKETGYAINAMMSLCSTLPGSLYKPLSTKPDFMLCRSPYRSVLFAFVWGKTTRSEVKILAANSRSCRQGSKAESLISMTQGWMEERLWSDAFSTRIALELIQRFHFMSARTADVPSCRS